MVQSASFCAKDANEMAVKYSFADIKSDKAVSKDALNLLSVAMQSFIEDMLLQAALEANESGKMEVEVSDLEKIWPYVMLRY
ncbi:CENP-S associating centromere protein X domain-containing protein [Ditylenchus destructor]|uniref:CENP-S associating centromere protein X domain-containing protein n=1 Tax=Ditylenchus destructor TaxID=166010 RepID=A0AAD4N8G1_9BILA|nr:CENP-S associating centromere protein X domain-containing protein [Ditylenchus destructor]